MMKNLLILSSFAKIGKNWKALKKSKCCLKIQRIVIFIYELN